MPNIKHDLTPTGESHAAVPSSRRLNASAPLRIDGGDSADLSQDRTLSIADGAMPNLRLTPGSNIVLSPGAITASGSIALSPNIRIDSARVGPSEALTFLGLGRGQIFYGAGDPPGIFVQGYQHFLVGSGTIRGRQAFLALDPGDVLTFGLPLYQGNAPSTAGRYLTSGELSAAGTFTGSGTPGGPTNSLQYNTGTGFGGDAALEWNPTNKILVISGMLSVPSIVGSGVLFLRSGPATTGRLVLESPDGAIMSQNVFGQSRLAIGADTDPTDALVSNGIMRSVVTSVGNFAVFGGFAVSNAASDGPFLVGVRGRGTTAAHRGAPQAGDTLLTVGAAGFTTVSGFAAATTLVFTAGTPTASYIPGRVALATTDTAGVSAVRFGINDAGNVVVGSRALYQIDNILDPATSARRYVVSGELRSGLPGGPDGGVQYNASGVLQGDANLTWLWQRNTPVLIALGLVYAGAGFQATTTNPGDVAEFQGIPVKIGNGIGGRSDLQVSGNETHYFPATFHNVITASGLNAHFVTLTAENNAPTLIGADGWAATRGKVRAVRTPTSPTMHGFEGGALFIANDDATAFISIYSGDSAPAINLRGISMAGNARLNWADQSGADTGTYDVGIRRPQAGVLRIGNGTTTGFGNFETGSTTVSGSTTVYGFRSTITPRGSSRVESWWEEVVWLASGQPFVVTQNQLPAGAQIERVMVRTISGSVSYHVGVLGDETRYGFSISGTPGATNTTYNGFPGTHPDYATQPVILTAASGVWVVGSGIWPSGMILAFPHSRGAVVVTAYFIRFDAAQT